MDNTELQHLIETCRQADVVFVSPAGANLGIYRDWSYLYVLYALTACGVRLTFCQNTVGASGSALFDRFSLFVLRHSDVYVRESASQKWLRNNGLNAYLGVDTSLQLPPVSVPASERPYIAVVPTSLGNWHRDFHGFDDNSFFRSTLPNALGPICAKAGLDLRLVPHLHGKEREDEMLEALAEEFRVRGVAAKVEPNSGLHQYRESLAGASLVVSMRYHGLVLAAASGVPCVALAYENKMSEAASYFGLQKFCIPVSDASETAIAGVVKSALLEASQITSELSARSEPLRSIARGPILGVLSRQLRDGRP